jgi:hypothetical protein
MRFLSGRTFAILAVLALCCAAAQAQTATPARDLSGIWDRKSAAAPPWAPNSVRMFAYPMPLQAWAKEHCRRVGCGRGSDSAGVPRGDAYLQGEDPAIARCAPRGFPRMLLGGGLMEILQTPDRIFMRFYVNNEMREVWMDGRGHPETVDLTWKGHSIGRWDGDTLVVDTVGILGGENGKFKWLDSAGHPHSDALHVTERIRRTAPGTLEFDLTFEDPEAFTAPVRGKVIYELRPKEDESVRTVGPSVEYVTCEDRIFAEQESEAWPFITGEYPKPLFPPAGPDPD